MTKTGLLNVILRGGLEVANGAGGSQAAVDWPLFLARHDLVWTKPPQGWDDGVFLGDGDLGAMIDTRGGRLGWEVNRTSLYVNRSRMPVGRLELVTAGTLVGGEARLDLWNAEGSGRVTTDRGEVRWRSFVAAADGVLVIALEKSDGEAAAALEWRAAEARPPRKVFRKEAMAPGDLHPPAELERVGDGVRARQIYLGENGGALAVRVAGRGSDKAETSWEFHYVAVERGDDAGAAERAADRAVVRATERGPASLAAAHRAWWHAYYPASFLSVPDPRIESYYWIQIYKLGAALRAEGPALDLMGPWFMTTPWAMYWWNLNAQLTVSPLATANRLEQAESFWRMFDAGHAALHDNVRAEFRDEAMTLGRASPPDLRAPVDLLAGGKDGALEAGNLPWMLFYYREAARYLADDTMLRERVLPLLRPAVGFYLAHLKRGEDGKWHLPPTHSPELATLADANYDLMLLAWGLGALIEDHERLGIAHADLPRWRETLRDLPAFAMDETGFMIGPDRPLRESHRHFSHLLAVCPLRIVTTDDPGQRALVERSIRHWIGLLRQGGFLTGYTHTGASAMWSLLGEGDLALERLHVFLDRFGTANTLYQETGPVIETPLAAACSLQDMLLQSHGGKLRVFPAMPANWREASFATLRGEGAFLVSAVRREGRTAWVRVEALAGGRTVVKLQRGEWTSAAVLASSLAEGPKVEVSSEGEFALELPRGAWVELGEERLAPAPVERAESEANPWPRVWRAPGE